MYYNALSSAPECLVLILIHQIPKLVYLPSNVPIISNLSVGCTGTLSPSQRGAADLSDLLY